MSKDKIKPFGWHAALGQEYGWEYVLVTGHNEDIDTGTVPETISDITVGGSLCLPYISHNSYVGVR